MKIKSLFVSDFHLGTNKSQPEKILKLFDKYEFDNLFLIGDIVDITNGSYWPKSHYSVLESIFRMNCNIWYIPGNHDNHIRKLIKNANINIAHIHICGECIYKTLNGEKIFICHGDEFDGFIKQNPILYKIGDIMYELTHKLNKPYNYIRKVRGKQYKSLSAYMKSKIKKAILFINDFKTQALIATEKNKCHAIMMGHIHTPEISEMQDKKYYNTGDFCESCSYITEDFSGKLKLGYIK